MPVFAVVFLAIWTCGAVYLLSRRLRFGKYGVFLGGRLLFEGPPILIHSRWRHRLTIAVLASDNKRRPTALKFDGSGPTAVGQNIYSLADSAAHELRTLLSEAHAVAINDRTLRNHRVGSIRMLWITLSVYARTETSLVGIGLLGRVRAIPDDQLASFIHSYDLALEAGRTAR